MISNFRRIRKSGSSVLDEDPLADRTMTGPVADHDTDLVRAVLQRIVGTIGDRIARYRRIVRYVLPIEIETHRAGPDGTALSGVELGIDSGPCGHNDAVRFRRPI